MFLMKWPVSVLIEICISQVAKKEELRGRLVELLSGPQQTLCTVAKEEDKMKRQV